MTTGVAIAGKDEAIGRDDHSFGLHVDNDRVRMVLFAGRGTRPLLMYGIERLQMSTLCGYPKIADKHSFQNGQGDSHPTRSQIVTAQVGRFGIRIAVRRFRLVSMPRGNITECGCGWLVGLCVCLAVLLFCPRLHNPRPSWSVFRPLRGYALWNYFDNVSRLVACGFGHAHSIQQRRWSVAARVASSGIQQDRARRAQAQVRSSSSLPLCACRIGSATCKCFSSPHRIMRMFPLLDVWRPQGPPVFLGFQK